MKTVKTVKTGVKTGVKTVSLRVKTVKTFVPLKKRCLLFFFRKNSFHGFHTPASGFHNSFHGFHGFHTSSHTPPLHPRPPTPAHPRPLHTPHPHVCGMVCIVGPQAHSGACVCGRDTVGRLPVACCCGYTGVPTEETSYTRK